MGSRRGVTLVEVMLAGALSTILMVAFLSGICMSARVSRENSEILAAEAYAWDTAWKWLNKKDDDLNDSDAAAFYPNANASSWETIASNECPVIYYAGAPARCVVRVQGQRLAQTGTRTAILKQIDVNVEWGAAGSRHRLNSVGTSTAAAYDVPITVYKAPMDRGE